MVLLLQKYLTSQGIFHSFCVNLIDYLTMRRFHNHGATIKQLILKNLPSSRQKCSNYTLFTVKLAQINILFMIKTAKNHTLRGLYRPYNGVPPPGVFPHPTISFISFCKKKYVPEMIPNVFKSLSCSSNT